MMVYSSLSVFISSIASLLLSHVVYLSDLSLDRLLDKMHQIRWAQFAQCLQRLRPGIDSGV